MGPAVSAERASGTADLPRTVPIFPLSGALLLPRGQLPLQIFEPRYLAMTRDALAGDRMIGMIQPRRPERIDPGDCPEVFAIGCLGRITAFSETGDGARLFITLTGVGRFELERELPALRGYRRAAVRYERFARDLAPEAGDRPLDRKRLLMALRGYLAQKGAAVDESALESLGDEPLVTKLAMVLPFEPGEKQALLECAGLGERGRVLTSLLEMALAGGADAPARPQ